MQPIVSGDRNAQIPGAEQQAERPRYDCRDDYIDPRAQAPPVPVMPPAWDLHAGQGQPSPFQNPDNSPAPNGPMQRGMTGAQPASASVNSTFRRSEPRCWPDGQWRGHQSEDRVAPEVQWQSQRLHPMAQPFHRSHCQASFVLAICPRMDGQTSVRSFDGATCQ